MNREKISPHSVNENSFSPLVYFSHQIPTRPKIDWAMIYLLSHKVSDEIS